MNFVNSKTLGVAHSACWSRRGFGGDNRSIVVRWFSRSVATRVGLRCGRPAPGVSGFRGLAFHRGGMIAAALRATMASRQPTARAVPSDAAGIGRSQPAGHDAVREIRPAPTLNRQVEREAKEGVKISLSTLADQIGACAVAPQRLHDLITIPARRHDDRPVKDQVAGLGRLRRDGKGACVMAIWIIGQKAGKIGGTDRFRQEALAGLTP